MKCVLVFVVSAFAQIYYCNGVLERSFSAEHTADKDLEHSQRSQRSQFKSGGRDFGDLENYQKPAVPFFGAHFLHGSTNGRMVQPHSSRQQHHQDQQQQQKLDIKHHQCQQHQQKQRPQAVKTIIANNRQMPKNNQQTGPAEQHMSHQHQPNYKLNRQYNNNNNHNVNYHIDRSNGSNKRNDNKHRGVQGHYDQFGIVHENNQNNSNIKNNYHNNFTMSKTNNINTSNVAKNINGDANSAPRSIPKLAIKDTATATTTKKASATTATMTTTASTPADQKGLPLKSIAGIQNTLPSTSTPVQQPIPQNTKLLNINTVSNFIANHVPPTTKSPRLATGDMSTLHFRRSVSNNPFLQYQPLRNQNVETSSAEKFFKLPTFMQNPFFQNHSLPNPSNQIPLVPNNESTQNPWLHTITPKPTNPGYAMQNPYTPVVASNPFIPNFPIQTPSEPSPDRTPDPFMPFMPNFPFNPTTSIPNKMSTQRVPAVSTSAQIGTQNVIKSQTDENISSTPSTSSTSTTQSIVTPSSAIRAPTISPALNELIKKGAIIFPDLLYPTTTTSSAQQLIDIRRR
ncbi:homeobox protein 2-like [Anastrepha ludens]|uniref:homeobox protein 2-like n=1 Tax=Anastrepha ludens TaxID=28586 RepID=UPI0023B0916F|nr:homeobox protein 2-like [Anastrepha ludens]